ARVVGERVPFACGRPLRGRNVERDVESLRAVPLPRVIEPEVPADASEKDDSVASAVVSEGVKGTGRRSALLLPYRLRHRSGCRRGRRTAFAEAAACAID